MQDENIWQACIRTVMQQTFHQYYWHTFSVARADSDADREKVFRLRYGVYCASADSAEGSENPAHIERDAFDDRAVHHMLIHKGTGDLAGTVRVLMPCVSRPMEGFEIQAHCPHPLLNNEDRVQHICEISRLCMSDKFRRRPGDGRVLPAYSEQEAEDGMMPLGKAVMRRRITYAPLGLMMAAFETVMDIGILDCVSLMDPADFRSLKRLGMPHKILGGRVDVRGPHQPVIYNIRNALDGMEAANPECWEIVSDKGRLTRRAHEIQLENWHQSIFEETAKPGLFSRFL